ncbi:hypothetical protein D9756_004190 [Leucocoprinus leucothites]|uniref:Protein kinase domain-containing protein n=1 Tax=Leucocoprinus leucothites TaxID=201217 RepID=A0A8H5DAQ2_9AGAR|nr:hypothetical protein D9756_004190 [Leucoagaricus leucothites]
MTSIPAHFTGPPPKPSLTSEAMGLLNKKFIGAVEDEWALFSDRASDYTIGESIGYGASSTVYAAMYRPSPTPGEPHNPPTPIPCALKVLDLDSLPRRSLQLLQRETTLMSLSKHPNVLRVRGSWIDGHKLYIALRLMNKGSAADVMHYGWPGGMEEEVIRCILRQALQGLNYLHVNGFIHRDIKAANLLIDDDGTVLLGDLGVAADMSEDSSQHMALSTKFLAGSATATLAQAQPRRSVAFQSRPKIIKRKSFVGTPCWMAPELIAGRRYDSAADIWSFGITALELSQGRPPRSRESSKDVLLRVIHDAPPMLDREGGVHKYSRAFKDMIDSCLVKDPSKRPSAEQLLQTPFFKNAKKKSYLINTILRDLPPLTQRQERREGRHPPTVATIESWDFASTVHSPTSTIHYRRRQFDDLPMTTPEREHSIGVFHFDDDESSDPQEGNHPSTSSSSSDDGGTSTDAVTEGLSTPPTIASLLSESPPSPKSSPESDPVAQPSSRSEEVVKKGFWSRISSGVRRPSVSNGKISPLIVNSEPTCDIGRSPPQLSSKCVGVEQQEVLGESPNLKNLMKRPSKDLTKGRPGISEAAEGRHSSGLHSSACINNAGKSGSPGRGKGMENGSTFKARRPSSRGSILGGFIGEAKQMLSKS